MNLVEAHEAANIFPLDEEHLDELADDIRKNGLRSAIELLDGKVIDGRRRQLACNRAGVEPAFCDIDTDDPVAYVLSLNLYRRHLKTSQAATCAARAEVLKAKLQEDAKRRMSEGGKAGGRGRSQQGPANCPDPISQGDTRDRLGAMFGVSGKSVERARKVINHGIPELVGALDGGELSVNKAEYIASQPPELQKGLLEAERGKAQKGQRDAEPREAVEEEKNGEVKSRGVGVRLAHEAINCLSRIPKNDALRKRGFQVVTDWLRRNR